LLVKINKIAKEGKIQDFTKKCIQKAGLLNHITGKIFKNSPKKRNNMTGEHKIRSVFIVNA